MKTDSLFAFDLETPDP